MSEGRRGWRLPRCPIAPLLAALLQACRCAQRVARFMFLAAEQLSSQSPYGNGVRAALQQPRPIPHGRGMGRVRLPLIPTACRPSCCHPPPSVCFPQLPGAGDQMLCDGREAAVCAKGERAAWPSRRGPWQHLRREKEERWGAGLSLSPTFVPLTRSPHHRASSPTHLTALSPSTPLPRTPEVTTMLEVGDLAQASPAAVSSPSQGVRDDEDARRAMSRLPPAGRTASLLHPRRGL